MSKSETTEHLRARLEVTGDVCGPSLLACYADQITLTGKHTTADDAISAWLRWVEKSGGRVSQPSQPSDWPNGYMRRVAAAIREVARYV